MVAPLRTLGLLGLLATTASAQDIELEKKHTRWRFTFEDVDLPGTDDLGVVGVHYDVLSPLPEFPPLYVGLGGYAGVSGEEQGSFLVGGTLGTIWHPAPLWSIDAGLFLGAGSDAGGRTTDGWATRPFVAVERVFGLYGVRFEVALLDMDEFERDWTFGIGFTLPSEVLSGREREMPRAIPSNFLVQRKVRITPRWLGLDPDGGTRSRVGDTLSRDVSMMGIGIDYFLTPHVFVPLEAYGATGGGLAGFVAAGAGLGGSWPLGNSGASLETKAVLLSGGGGAVDTGGGLGWQAMIGLRSPVVGPLALEVLAGRTDFFDGDFGADTLSVGLTWTSRPLELGITYPRGNLDRAGLSDSDAQLDPLRVTVATKALVPPSDARTKSGEEHEPVLSLLGFGVEKPVHENLALTARAFAAFDGGVGGYSEGFLGARAELEPTDWERLRVSASFEAGAAGGGNVDVGSGLVFHSAAGLAIDLTRSTFVQLEWGKTEASDGTFEAEAITLSLGWTLQRPVLRD